MEKIIKYYIQQLRMALPLEAILWQISAPSLFHTPVREGKGTPFLPAAPIVQLQNVIKNTNGKKNFTANKMGGKIFKIKRAKK